MLSFLFGTALTLLPVAIATEQSLLPTGHVPIMMVDPVKIATCFFDFDARVADPNKYPMDKAVTKEESCKSTLAQHNLLDLADSIPDDAVVQPTGFVYHESRVGSTLVANMFAVNPDNILYSESHATSTILSMGKGTSMTDRVRSLRAVVKLMGYTQLARHKKMFFKFQSVKTLSLEVITAAFPDVPWVYLHRNPVEVMASHLLPGDQLAPKAPCLKPMKGDDWPFRISHLLSRPAEPLTEANAEDRLSEFCAAHLLSLELAAINAINKPASKGIFVDYKELPEAVVDRILPHFGVANARETHPEWVEKALAQSKTYAKNSKKKAAEGEYQSDSETKQDKVNRFPLVKQWTETLLGPIYEYISNHPASSGVVPAGAEVPIYAGPGANTASMDAIMLNDLMASEMQAVQEEDSEAHQAFLAFSARHGIEAERDAYLPYPPTSSFSEMMQAWPTGMNKVPASYKDEDSGLEHLDYSNPTDLERAFQLRHSEVPFVLRNVPGVTEMTEKWTWSYMLN
jgi:hypothetical protein